jgi:hypothetical protein
MKVVKMLVKDIIPYENNPRKNDSAVDAVVESFKQCGYIAPIIIDESHVILAGHTRLKAAKKLGWKDVEVIVREGLTDEQKKKYRILDNKTNEFAEWDFEKLEAELSGLDFGGFDFNFEMPQWSQFEQPNQEVRKNESNGPVFRPEGVTEGPEGAEGTDDPYLPEGYDDSEIQEYTENQENYVVKRRVIITYLPEQEEEVAKLLNVKELTKVVYDYDELSK